MTYLARLRCSNGCIEIVDIGIHISHGIRMLNGDGVPSHWKSASASIGRKPHWWEFWIPKGAFIIIEQVKLNA